MQSSREKAISSKTLICFLQSLINQQIVVELKNDFQVLGSLKSVDAFMNVELTDVTIKKPIDLAIPIYDETTAHYLFIIGPKIRYVFFSEEVDIISNIQDQLKLSHRSNY